MRSRVQLALCALFGLVAFPVALSSPLLGISGSAIYSRDPQDATPIVPDGQVPPVASDFPVLANVSGSVLVPLNDEVDNGSDNLDGRSLGGILPRIADTIE